MAHAGDFKPYYVWSFSKPSPAKYRAKIGARLPVLGRPAFGSDLNLPSALPDHPMNPPRTYIPSGTFWSSVEFSGEEKLLGLDTTGVTMRYDPAHEFSSMDMSARKVIRLTEALKLSVRDAYTFHSRSLASGRFDAQEVGWNTTKSLELSTTRTRTRFAAAMNTSKHADNWRARFSVEQPLGKAIRLSAAVTGLETQDPTSRFQARFSRRW
ncbi:hypothetical protein [Roseibium salinum]|uniref:Uncharacterized protein n=1 Tax=Roseibium salinum TaxID=1604349 RepID=A0ABT3QWZ3_9HYPH|nr:hypothetical protein [Roseibium sp. DSM 29163]MCX2721452.1 hypothetical protein [Roseibium sp. DSM 29163]